MITVTRLSSVQHWPPRLLMGCLQHCDPRILFQPVSSAPSIQAQQLMMCMCSSRAPYTTVPNTPVLPCCSKALAIPPPSPACYVFAGVLACCCLPGTPGHHKAESEAWGCWTPALRRMSIALTCLLRQ